MPRDEQQQHTWPCRTLVMLQLLGICVWRGQSDPRDGAGSAAAGLELSMAQKNGSQWAPKGRAEQGRGGGTSWDWCVTGRTLV